jgi:hypothetical protein
VPDLPDRVTGRVRLLALAGKGRRAVPIMPRQLLSIRAFADVRRKLADFATTGQQREILEGVVLPLPVDLPAAPAPLAWPASATGRGITKPGRTTRERPRGA